MVEHQELINSVERQPSPGDLGMRCRGLSGKVRTFPVSDQDLGQWLCEHVLPQLDDLWRLPAVVDKARPELMRWFAPHPSCTSRSDCKHLPHCESQSGCRVLLAFDDMRLRPPLAYPDLPSAVGTRTESAELRPPLAYAGVSPNDRHLVRPVRHLSRWCAAALRRCARHVELHPPHRLQCPTIERLFEASGQLDLNSDGLHLPALDNPDDAEKGCRSLVALSNWSLSRLLTVLDVLRPWPPPPRTEVAFEVDPAAHSELDQWHPVEGRLYGRLYVRVQMIQKVLDEVSGAYRSGGPVRVGSWHRAQSPEDLPPVRPPRHRADELLRRMLLDPTQPPAEDRLLGQLLAFYLANRFTQYDEQLPEAFSRILSIAMRGDVGLGVRQQWNGVEPWRVRQQVADSLAQVAEMLAPQQCVLKPTAGKPIANLKRWKDLTLTLSPGRPTQELKAAWGRGSKELTFADLNLEKGSKQDRLTLEGRLLWLLLVTPGNRVSAELWEHIKRSGKDRTELKKVCSNLRKVLCAHFEIAEKASDPLPRDEQSLQAVFKVHLDIDSLTDIAAGTEWDDVSLVHGEEGYEIRIADPRGDEDPTRKPFKPHDLGLEVPGGGGELPARVLLDALLQLSTGHSRGVPTVDLRHVSSGLSDELARSGVDHLNYVLKKTLPQIAGRPFERDGMKLRIRCRLHVELR